MNTTVFLKNFSLFVMDDTLKNHGVPNKNVKKVLNFNFFFLVSCYFLCKIR